MKDIRLLINNIEADVMLEDELDFRIQRVIQNEDDFLDKGGDFTFQISLPVTPNNNRIFGGLTSLSQYRKFNFKVPYSCQLYVRGVIVLNGSFLLTSVTSRRYQGEMTGSNADWLEKLNNIKLCEIGYKNNEPTWFQLYRGINTANSLNSLNDNTQSNIVFPTILYNNSPITDYKDYFFNDIFGVQDPNTGEEIQAPLDFPDVFPTFAGAYASRMGLTFEDFPPALYYRNVIEKVFEQVGLSVTCDLFSEDWFNQLIMPFTGDEVQWNWKTLAYLLSNTTPEVREFTTEPFLQTDMQIIFTQTDPLGNFSIIAEERNVLRNDNPNTRVDRIANFKKWKVSDGENSSYVCPTSGRYKIKVKSQYKRYVRTTINGSTPFSNIGQGGAGLNPYPFNWSNNMLVVARQNQAGEYALNETWRDDMLKYIDNRDNDFINNPSDVIAYYSPMLDFYNTPLAPIPDEFIKGSPLTDNESEVIVNSFSHSLTPGAVPPPPGIRDYNCESHADIEVEVDLLKNERIYIFWYGPVLASNNLGGGTEECETNCNFETDSEVEIEFICGYEDLDLAALLPCSSAKDFIADFIAQFNLDFFLKDDTIDFKIRSTTVNNKTFNIDISEFIHADTIEFTPARVPINYIVGYDNDDDDRLLTQAVSGCTEDSRSVTEYANVQFSGSDNIYAQGTKEIRNFFSATRFAGALFELIPYPIQQAQPIFLPGATPAFETHIDFGPTKNLRFDIPSIQSDEQFNVSRLGDLSYKFKYKPRLIVYRGTYKDIMGVLDDRFLVNAPDITAVTREHHWMLPTVCSFHYENSDITLSPRTFTLRYDTINGLYNKYFNDTIDSRGDAYIMKADMSITPYLWTQLDGSKFVTYQDDLYQILKIEDYDPINNNPAIITLLKLV